MIRECIHILNHTLPSDVSKNQNVILRRVATITILSWKRKNIMKLVNLGCFEALLSVSHIVLENASSKINSSSKSIKILVSICDVLSIFLSSSIKYPFDFNKVFHVAKTILEKLRCCDSVIIAAANLVSYLPSYTFVMYPLLPFLDGVLTCVERNDNKFHVTFSLWSLILNMAKLGFCRIISKSRFLTVSSLHLANHWEDCRFQKGIIVISHIYIEVLTTGEGHLAFLENKVVSILPRLYLALFNNSGDEVQGQRSSHQEHNIFSDFVNFNCVGSSLTNTLEVSSSNNFTTYLHSISLSIMDGSLSKQDAGKCIEVLFAELGSLSISESEISPFFEALSLLLFKFKESFIARFASHEASMIVNYIQKNLTSIVLKAVSPLLKERGIRKQLVAHGLIQILGEALSYRVSGFLYIYQ